MTKPTLYLFIGYPGAGKTTLAQLIAKQTGAKHIWADRERHKLFPNPSHSETESQELYRQLNDAAAYLLRQGKSVIFDTNFNFLADRNHLRQLARDCGANTVIIWVNTPLSVAKQRAVHDQVVRNGYQTTMSAQQFDAIARKLEPPLKTEKVIKIDGTEFDEKGALAQLSLV